MRGSWIRRIHVAVVVLVAIASVGLLRSASARQQDWTPDEPYGDVVEGMMAPLTDGDGGTLWVDVARRTTRNGRNETWLIVEYTEPCRPHADNGLADCGGPNDWREEFAIPNRQFVVNPHLSAATLSTRVGGKRLTVTVRGTSDVRQRQQPQYVLLLSRDSQAGATFGRYRYPQQTRDYSSLYRRYEKR